MKTSLEIEDSLFQEARLAAVKQRTTLRELVERGLRKELDAIAQAPSKRVDLTPFVVTGDRPGPIMGWESLRDEIYGLGEPKARE